MEENKIIVGSSSHKKIMLKVTMISFIITIITLIMVMVIPIVIDKKKAYFNRNSIYWGGYGETKQCVNQLYTLYVLEEWGTYLLGLCVFVTIVFLLLYFCFYKMQIVVTDKRVYGRTSFGKQVDLPLDSISSVGTHIFQGITVGTSSGKIIFWDITNRDKLYEEIKIILANRQEKEINVKGTSTVTNIIQEQSSAEELKKFKDLLDSGIITQGEFEAKKKQLLGL